MEICERSNDNSLAIPERNELCQSNSAPSSPTKTPILFQELMNKKSGENTSSAKPNRTVKFPEDHAIVSGYLEATVPFGASDRQEYTDQDLDSIVAAFEEACTKQNIKPIPSVVEQIKNFKSIRVRAQDLILRGQKLEAPQCEALEEIFKRVLFRFIDLDSCDLDCDGSSALFDMIEFYESASHLSIANNKSIGIIGWQALCRTLKKTSCLQYLDLSNTGLNEQILLFMGRTIRVGSHLVTLHLENVGLTGRRLAILVSSIKFNTSLRELYLNENKISSADCVQIGNLLRGNGYLNILDLRNNFIQDTGLDHICEGLAHQPSGTSSASVFSLFSLVNKTNLLSQNTGILILNLSNNQLTSRAMNKLAHTLPQCHSLIGLDLSHNFIGDEGIFILKEGLIQCKTLKYLNMAATDITNEGAKAIAGVIGNNTGLTTIDLSNNVIGLDGIKAIQNSISLNKCITKLVIIPQNNSAMINNNSILNELLSGIDSVCNQNRLAATFDEYDFILGGFLHSDISVYQELETDDNKKTDNDYFTCDTIMQPEDNVDSNNDKINEEEDDLNRLTGKKPCLGRTTSLGSWERPVKSGRFSVSPVEVIDYNLESIETNENSPVQIKVESDESMVIQSTISLENQIYNSDDDNNSDLSEQETDQVPELPTCFSNKNRLMPPSRSFRRMSSPIISVTGVIAKQKPKPNLTLKLSGNLESLDLKSSLPLSPTFFAKFDFSDLSMLRLPADVEEIVSNINNSIADDLIFQFENFCCDKPSKHDKPSQQFVY